jgi:hypothetical protein
LENFAMASSVEISRLALAHIADAARVNSINPPDNTIQAQHCATFYPIARDECLEAYPWPFATTVKELAQSLVTLPDGEWSYAYQLPTSMIRVLRVVPPGAAKDHPGEDYVLRMDESGSDQLLLTNCPEARLHHIFRQEQTGLYSPMFVAALSYLLGSHLAGPILKGRIGAQVKQSLYAIYRDMIDRAATRSLGSAGKREENYAAHKPIWMSDR